MCLVSFTTCNEPWFFKVLDGFPWGVSCNHNKNHEGHPAPTLAPEKYLWRLATSSTEPQAFLARCIIIDRLRPTLSYPNYWYSVKVKVEREHLNSEMRHLKPMISSLCCKAIIRNTEMLCSKGASSFSALGSIMSLRGEFHSWLILVMFNRHFRWESYCHIWITRRFEKYDLDVI